MQSAPHRIWAKVLPDYADPVSKQMSFQIHNTGAL